MGITLKNTVCEKEGCGCKAVSRHLCGKHYQALIAENKASGEWNQMKRGFRDICSVSGCGMKHLANGLCQKHYTQKIKEINRQFIMERYFPDGVICKKCGKQYQLVQMDAHHPDPEKKEHILSVLLNNSALQERPELLAELDECEMVCTRCHQNRHHDPLKTHEETYQRKDKGRGVDEMKKAIRNIFGDKCVDCGDVLLPKEMEFHHRNPKEKVDNVSDMMRTASKNEVMVEVGKCDIVCRNCHRLRLGIAA